MFDALEAMTTYTEANKTILEVILGMNNH